MCQSIFKNQRGNNPIICLAFRLHSDALAMQKMLDASFTVHLEIPLGQLQLLKMAQSLQASLSTLCQCKSDSNKALTTFLLIWQVMELYDFPWETFTN